jgi:predicted Zn-dependent peptidase
MTKPTITTLENGLRLIMVPMPQMESVTVLVGVGAGSRHETRRVNGLFHFIEHMAFKGTKKRSSTLAIATEVDAVGGEFNAFTDKELTGYFIKLAAKHKKLAFDILSDMLTNSLFNPEEVERERGVIIEEINMYDDLPMRRVAEVFERLLYGDNPMGWNTAGEKKSVQRITRQDFLDYVGDLYFAPNISVCVAGKLVKKTMSHLTSQYFGKLKKYGKKQIKTIKPSQRVSKLKLVSKKTEQAHFCLGLSGYELTHPDRWVLGVLSAVLGAGMSSRLFIEVRERRGLAYYVQAEPEFYTDSGYLVARAGVRLNQIEEAIKVMLTEFDCLRQKRVTEKELKKAREFLKGHLILTLEDSKQVAGRYASQLLLEGKLRTPAETMRLIDEVTAADIQRVAKNIFQPKKLNLAIIGPYKNEAPFKKLLKF